MNSLFVGGYDFCTPPPDITKDGVKPYPERRRPQAEFAHLVLLPGHRYHAGHVHAPGERGFPVPRDLPRQQRQRFRRRQDVQGHPAAQYSGGASSGHSPCTTTRPARCSIRRNAIRAPAARAIPRPPLKPTQTAPRPSTSVRHNPPASRAATGSRPPRQGMVHDPAPLQPAPAVLRQDLAPVSAEVRNCRTGAH